MEKLVSVVIPCLNEEKYIARLLGALSKQTYFLEKIEVIVADGGSKDDTIRIIKNYIIDNSNLNILIINNPEKSIPAGVNLAIKASSGDIIIRMDAHSVPDKNYISYCVENLIENKGMNVGGLWLIKPGGDTWVSESIAIAASHPFGVGDAKYRYGEKSSYVDTVPFGAFYRTVFNEIGYFDEDLLTNEDYELNVRIRKSGGKIYFDPRIKIDYFARDTFKSLSKQYWRYGFWKYKMLMKYPETIRWRQAIPPLFILSLIFLALASIFLPLALKVLIVEIGLYLSVIFLGSLKSKQRTRKGLSILGVPIAISVMHFSWGLGFLISIFRKH